MTEHLPILQVIVPLLGAPLCLLVRVPRLVGLFALLVSTITFLISCSLLQQVLLHGTIIYELGGWPAPWGIEYRIDYLNSYLLLLVTGMGAIVLNGAKIGSNCLVGAGALITEGKEFPDNSMIIGSPAKAVREVDDKMRAMIARGADVYVRRWKQYAAGLKRIA